MKKILIIFLIINFNNFAQGSVNEKIITSLKRISNLSFDFEQNVNGKIENGKCIIKYPKKINCKYDDSNNKILVSNGNSLVIKTEVGSYYRYPLKNTPLDLILDKNFILNEIKNLNKKIIDNDLISFSLKKEEVEIQIFFNKDTYNINGWQTSDIYQNKSLTIISNIIKNKEIKPEIFKLPKFN